MPLAAFTDDKGLTLSSRQGEAASVELPGITVPGSASFSLSIDEIPKEEGKWSPYIYYALKEKDGPGDFRLFILQQASGKALVAGTEFNKDGRNIFRKALITDIPLKAKVDFTLAWDSTGKLIYSIMGGEKRELNTGFRNFNAIVHVSNATATFYP